MERDYYPYRGHQFILKGELKPCPFCGEMPYIESCDRLIAIGCEPCNYHMAFHGLVQSELETEVSTSPYGEWYDKDAYKRAGEKWNRRKHEEQDAKKET